ncbi:hypothetical protein FPZ24_11770 [Sphingomonas panacisoli]|uniref:Uncharacterized protein n=1 Tax=Sphingomonas panacisoli TaxID=1813879 RepID=A0A5B8LK21_9SPHN|nr:MBOAT family O-acyltransferase [Sphingomonas panacisoli]QDZ08075.1 hypothetical protein FPZ24_11770 [Sphingomonas panacisoli]
MFNQNEIAINSVMFWAVAFAAIALLNMASGVRAKSYLFAGVNLAFLFLLLGKSVVFVPLFVGAVFVVLQSFSIKSAKLATLTISSTILFFMFMVNKLQASVASFTAVGSILAIVGFSFITLRCVEVIRGVFSGQHAAPSLVMLTNYLVPFHMLAAGPIAAYDDFARKPFDDARLTNEDVMQAVEVIARGLFNKFVLCYFIDKIFLSGFRSDGAAFVLETLMFTLWSYLDFSSYSNIALGIGKLAGVTTPVNFRNPLISRNVIDFWDRWHISLSHFVKRNVFMPIQIALMRSRMRPRPLLYASFATTVSFLLVGLWHGIALKWLTWGALHALGLVGVRVYTHFLQKALTPQQMVAYRKNMAIRVVATVVTYVYVAFAFLAVALIGR